MVMVAIIILSIGLYTIISTDGTITSSSTVKHVKCVEPEEASKLIKEYGCTEINKDPECKKKGFVELEC